MFELSTVIFTLICFILAEILNLESVPVRFDLHRHSSYICCYIHVRLLLS